MLKLKIYLLLFALSTVLLSCMDFYFENKNPDLQLSAIPRKDSAEQRFIVLSDWGFNGGLDQKKVAEAMVFISEQAGLNFIVTAGDNFQYSGVPSSTDTLWKLNYENVYNDSALNVTWYPVLGNHDHYGNTQAEIDYSTLNPKWHMPTAYYSFKKSVGNNDSILFVMLDTQSLVEEYALHPDSSGFDSIPQYKWLKNSLKNNTTKWTIVVGHHTLYSASTFHGDTPEIKAMLKPLLDKYKTDFYICGHDHHFEHARDIANYTDYIVTGTGGYVRPIGSNEHTVFSISKTGFSYFIAKPNSLKMFFVGSDKKLIYTFEKKKLPETHR